MRIVVIGGAGLIGSKSDTFCVRAARGDRRLTESRRQYDLPQKGRKKLAGAHVVIDLSN